jgi:DNA polymerase III epsilon subunit-like protein
MIDISKLAREGSFLSFDIEGDGNPGQRPVEISFCEFNADGFVREHYFLIDPERPMNHFAMRKHGMTDEFVRGRETLRDVSSRIRELVTDRILVGHASINDVNLISSGITDFLLLPTAIIDTQKIARRLSRIHETPIPEALSAFAKVYGISTGDAPVELSRSGLHSASTDAWLTGTIFKHTMPLLPNDYHLRKQYSEMFTLGISNARRREIEDKIAEENTESLKL